MSDQKISGLTELASGNISGSDLAVVVDVSDTTDAASGTTKKTLLSSILAYIQANLSASGDVSGPSSSVDSEVALFSGTGGKTIKRASATGIAKLVSGVLSAVTAPSGAIVGDTDAQTLTNKDISGASNTYRAASDTVSGAAELATAAETTTGTDATRAVTPDGLAGSDYGKRIVGIQVVDSGTDAATGDGKAFFRIPAALNGYNLVGVAMSVYTAGTTNTTDVQLRRTRSGTDADMLSTKLTIDSTEVDTLTAATAAVINGSNDDVATGDKISVDVDAVSTTPPKGLYVELTFQLP